jgi:acylphosphatase
MASVRFVVSGRVQGVFFRASTREEAMKLGISGHARNLDDGRVEVVANGSDDALATLEAWLHHGPSSARVDRVERMRIDDRDDVGFVTR